MSTRSAFVNRQLEVVKVTRLLKAETGYGALEFLIAAPLLLLLGLGSLQWVWVLQERTVLEYAVQEAVRAGATGNAMSEAIERGLAKGLQPFWAVMPSDASAGDRQQASSVALARAQAQGWVRWRLVSPNTSSFDDWAVAAFDDHGRSIPGVREIPNDNLSLRQRFQQPTSGSISGVDGQRIGAASGQSLMDANVIKVEIYVGLPLRVPLAGSMMAWAVRLAQGCQAGTPHVVTQGFSSSLKDSASASELRCSVTHSGDEKVPRIPVHLSATTRMQSPARQSGRGVSGRPVPSVLDRVPWTIGAGSESPANSSDAQPPLPQATEASAHVETATEQPGAMDGPTLQAESPGNAMPDQPGEVVAVGACTACSSVGIEAGSCPK